MFSIIAQTFNAFELILVDDGSTDSSGRICDELTQTDSRIIVIHKENGGLSSARNAGIDKAKGSYLGFVDSDDYIAEDMYQLLYDNLIREDADISMCGLYNCYLGKEPHKIAAYYEAVDAKKAIELVMKGQVATVSAVNKLYKRELFRELRYPLGKQSEDAFIIIDLLMRCSKIVITSEQKYYYFHRENSITTKELNRHDYDVIEAHQRNYELIKECYPELRGLARGRICWAYFFILDKMAMATDVTIMEKQKIISFLRDNAGFIILKSHFSFPRKAAMFVLLFSQKGYYKMVR